MNLSQQDITNIISELDFAENKRINYSEFIAATINVSEYLTDERLQAIFNQFDIDNTGFISKSNMKQAFSKYGREIKDSDIDDILSKHDIAGDKAISFEEFKLMLFGNWRHEWPLTWTYRKDRIQRKDLIHEYENFTKYK